MVHPNLQNSLFPITRSEALKIANTTESIASQWYNQNYLSFNITLTPVLQNSQVLELTFISKIFSSSLSLDTINQLLSLLNKPYAYNFQRIYFDIFSNNWTYLPVENEQDEEKSEEIDNE